MLGDAGSAALPSPKPWSWSSKALFSCVDAARERGNKSMSKVHLISFNH